MLPQSHFIAFNDIKAKYFSNALRDSNLHVISCTRQLVAQELDKSHTLYASKFRRPTSEVGVLEPVCCSTSIKRVLVYIRST